MALDGEMFEGKWHGLVGRWFAWSPLDLEVRSDGTGTALWEGRVVPVTTTREGGKVSLVLGQRDHGQADLVAAAGGYYGTLIVPGEKEWTLLLEKGERRFPQLKEEWVAAHGVLRTLLDPRPGSCIIGYSDKEPHGRSVMALEGPLTAEARAKVTYVIVAPTPDAVPSAFVGEFIPVTALPGALRPAIGAQQAAAILDDVLKAKQAPDTDRLLKLGLLDRVRGKVRLQHSMLPYENALVLRWACAQPEKPAEGRRAYAPDIGIAALHIGVVYEVAMALGRKIDEVEAELWSLYPQEREWLRKSVGGTRRPYKTKVFPLPG